MKAIFAVSALAAAISAQAIAADTEATTTFSGEVNVGSTIDILNEDRYHNVTDGDDGWNLDMSVDVKNGGFSGSLAIEGSDGDADVTMGDVKYEEGSIAFGQLDSIVTTEAQVDDMSDDLDYQTDWAFRYTNADLGLTLQAENGANLAFDTDADGDVDGDDDSTGMTDFGLAAAYAGDFDIVTVAADVQYRESSNTTAVLPVGAPVASADEALAVYAGVLVTATPIDMLTVKANWNTGHATGAAFYDADTTVSQYGVRGDVTVMEGVTAYGFYSVVGDADANMEVGASATFAPLTVSASHHIQGDVNTTEASAVLSQDFAVSEALTVNAHAEASWVTDTDMDWSAGADATYAVTSMLSAYAGYEIDTAGDGNQLTAGVAYTTEGGASLTADYTNQNDVFDGNDGEAHKVEMKASYSF